MMVRPIRTFLVAALAFATLSSAARSADISELHGFWVLASQPCDEGDAIRWFREGRIDTSESTCDIKKATKAGNVFTVEKACNGEGEAWDDTETYELQTPKLLIVAGDIKFRKCPVPEGFQ